MLNDGVGKDFQLTAGVGDRTRTGRSDPRVLIVDPVIGSRILLADIVAQSGCVALTATTAADAIKALDREDITIVLVDEQIDGPGSGFALLLDLRHRFPKVPRALIADRNELMSLGQAVERADLSFLLAKPIDRAAVREGLNQTLRGESLFGTWDRVSLSRPTSPRRRIQTRASSGGNLLPNRRDRRHEVILRGLLAGLNSVESEAGLFSLVDRELAEPFQIQRWLSVDQATGSIARIENGDEAGRDEGARTVSKAERLLLNEAERLPGIRELKIEPSQPDSTASSLVCLGFVVGEEKRARLTCLVYCEASCSAGLEEMLRDLRHGMNLTIRRIADSARRAEAARELANRVSEELKTPVGALRHALHEMRSEVVRAGIATEWVDRVLSESQRVERAVDHLEGEVFPGPPRAPSL